MVNNERTQDEICVGSPRVITYSGARLDFDLIKPSVIYLSDIAHGLSNVCRYAGQCHRYYSVAEHSVLLARMANMRGAGAEIEFAALLHDASEAYMCDLPSGLKKYIPQYKDIEQTLMQAILNRFSIYDVQTGDMVGSTLIHDLDIQIRASEVHELFPAHIRDKFYTKQPTRLQWFDDNIWCFGPKDAEKIFTSTAVDIINRMGKTAEMLQLIAP